MNADFSKYSDDQNNDILWFWLVQSLTWLMHTTPQSPTSRHSPGT
jgi:hypothetical protein